MLGGGLDRAWGALAAGGDTGRGREAQRNGSGRAAPSGLGCDSEARVREPVNAGPPSPVCGPDSAAGS